MLLELVLMFKLANGVLVEMPATPALCIAALIEFEHAKQTRVPMPARSAAGEISFVVDFRCFEREAKAQPTS